MTDYGTIPLEDPAQVSKADSIIDLKSSIDSIPQCEYSDWDYVIVFPNSQANLTRKVSQTITKVRNAMPSVNLSSNSHLQKASDQIYAVRERIVSGISTGVSSVLDVFRSHEIHLTMEEMCQRIKDAGLEYQLANASLDLITNEPPYFMCQIRPSLGNVDAASKGSNSAGRIRLVESLLKSPTGANLNLVNLVASQVIVAAFPLHDENEKARLTQAWLHRKFLSIQPLDAIKSYFGAKITLYFAFMGHYTRWLFTAGILGSIVTLLQVIKFTFDLSFKLERICFDVTFCLFTVFIMAWITNMLERWKCGNIKLVKHWGPTECIEEDIEIRPQYRNALETSGEVLWSVDVKDRRRRLIISWSILALLLGTVSAFVSLTFYLRTYISVEHKEAFAINITSSKRIYLGGAAASMLNVIQISFMATFFEVICTKTTDYENHRTQEGYEKSFTLKFVVFQMVNNFAALFYIAFVKSVFGGTCDENDCLQELQTTLIVIFGSQLVASNIQQAFQQRVSIWFTKIKAGVDITSNVLPCEAEFYLIEFGWREMFDTYMKVVLQVGFTVFFASAFPLASLLSFFNNVFTMRINSYQLLTTHRRPRPLRASNLGVWIVVLDTMAVLAVFTNSILVVYTSGIFSTLESSDRALLLSTLIIMFLLFRCHFWFALAN